MSDSRTKEQLIAVIINQLVDEEHSCKEKLGSEITFKVIAETRRKLEGMSEYEILDEYGDLINRHDEETQKLAMISPLPLWCHP
ncbi:MAG: hypothetical protein JKP92_02520 [Alphaproteobacteria bacterium]|nr:hypothetical protein [Alphaproteobacteria bacterium]